MFKLASSERFWALVKVEYQREEGGRGTAAFNVQYRRLPIPRVKALFEENTGAENADLKTMQEIVCDWKNVTDEEGAEIPFSQDELVKLYNMGFGSPVVKLFFSFFPQAKEKN